TGGIYTGSKVLDDLTAQWSNSRVGTSGLAGRAIVGAQCLLAIGIVGALFQSHVRHPFGFVYHRSAADERDAQTHDRDTNAEHQSIFEILAEAILLLRRGYW